MCCRGSETECGGIRQMAVKDNWPLWQIQLFIFRCMLYNCRCTTSHSSPPLWRTYPCFNTARTRPLVCTRCWPWSDLDLVTLKNVFRGEKALEVLWCRSELDLATLKNVSRKKKALEVLWCRRDLDSILVLCMFLKKPRWWDKINLLMTF
jgi:hypothetical protein